MPPTYVYEISFKITHRDEGPDIPSLNPNAMALAMREFVLETSPDTDITIEIAHARLLQRIA